jgi:hypothetical protein
MAAHAATASRRVRSENEHAEVHRGGGLVLVGDLEESLVEAGFGQVEPKDRTVVRLVDRTLRCKRDVPLVAEGIDCARLLALTALARLNMGEVSATKPTSGSSC